jgi:hypothetical protein
MNYFVDNAVNDLLIVGTHTKTWSQSKPFIVRRNTSSISVPIHMALAWTTLIPNLDLLSEMNIITDSDGMPDIQVIDYIADQCLKQNILVNFEPLEKDNLTGGWLLTKLTLNNLVFVF